MKILCVDDDVDIATLMDNVLSANGHYVTTCNSGADALAAISDNDFNLIFLDLEMPHISGREVIDSLSDCEIIFLVLSITFELINSISLT